MEKREYQKVMDALKERLYTGELQVGDRLPTERELATSLSVGRYSVREALRVMESFGLIRSRQGSGNYLAAEFGQNISDLIKLMTAVHQVDYVQITRVRRALEAEAYQDVVETGWNPEFEILERRLKEEKWGAQEDSSFHQLLYRTSKNALLIQLMEGLDENCRQQIQLFHQYADASILKELDRCHLFMLKGIRQGNSNCEKARQGQVALKEHYDLTLEEWERICSKISPAAIQKGR